METGTTRFEKLKKEILARAHKAGARKDEYGRAYGAETLDALMEVVRDNFIWCCDEDVLDGDIIDRYKAEFNAGNIWHNEAIVKDGMLLLDNSSAVLWGGKLQCCIAGKLQCCIAGQLQCCIVGKLQG